jgi:peroxiredoxin
MLRFVPLLFGLALLAGCGDSEPTGPRKFRKIDYGETDFAQLVSQFRDQLESNRQPATDKFPLSFLDSKGQTVDLGKFRDKSNVVLTVVKGLPQSPGGLYCPGCLAQMNSYSANVEGFKTRQTEVLVVFPGPSDSLSDFLTQAKATPAEGKPGIPMLLDKDMAACRRLDILGDWARPSTYILDKKGNVVYAYVGAGTTDRPSLKALFAELDKINAKK